MDLFEDINRKNNKLHNIGDSKIGEAHIRDFFVIQSYLYLKLTRKPFSRRPIARKLVDV